MRYVSWTVAVTLPLALYSTLSCQALVRAKPNPQFCDPSLLGRYCLLYCEYDGAIPRMDACFEMAYAERGQGFYFVGDQRIEAKEAPPGYFEKKIFTSAVLSPNYRPAISRVVPSRHEKTALLPNHVLLSWKPLWQAGVTINFSEMSCCVEEISLLSCQYRTGTTDGRKVIHFFSDYGLFAKELCGIYAFVDDILLLAVDVSRFHFWNTKYAFNEALLPKDFQAPFSPYATLKAFIVAVRIEEEANLVESAIPDAKALQQQRVKEFEGSYLWARRLDGIETYLELQALITKLAYALDRVPVSSEQPNGWNDRARRQAIELARTKFGELYPIARWTIQGRRIMYHKTWLGPPLPLFEYEVTPLSKNAGCLDMYPLTDDGKRVADVQLPGIYYLLDDFLFVCYNDWRTSGLPKGERPQRLTTSKQKPYTVEVLRRLHDGDLPQLDRTAQ